MAEQKLRRKTFIVTAGATLLGWLGVRAGGRRGGPAGTAALTASGDRVRKEPRAVPCSGKTL